MKQKSVVMITCVLVLYLISVTHSSGLISASASTVQATEGAASSAAHIFFSKSKDTTCDLYSADLGGQNPTCVAKALLSDTSADVQTAAKAAKVDLTSKDNLSISYLEAEPTPDETKLLILTHAGLDNFSTNVEIGASRLYYLDLAAGSAPKLLFQDVRKSLASDTYGLLDIAAQMSPDGTQVAYVLPGKDQLMVAALDGSSPRQISQTASGYGSLGWSPDGKQILVSSQGKTLLLDATAAKGKPQTLALPKVTNLPVYTNLVWSPDGKQALAIESEGPLYRYSFADKKAIKLSGDKLVPSLAYWLPDGQKVFFTAQPDQNTDSYDLYSVNPDGADLQKLVQDSASSFGLTVDGSHILYSTKDGIVQADPDGKNAQTLVKGAYLVAVTSRTLLS